MKAKKVSHHSAPNEDPEILRCAKLNGIHNSLSLYLSRNHKGIFRKAPKGKDYVVAMIYENKKKSNGKPILCFFKKKRGVKLLSGTYAAIAFCRFQ